MFVLFIGFIYFLVLALPADDKHDAVLNVDILPCEVLTAHPTHRYVEIELEVSKQAADDADERLVFFLRCNNQIQLIFS